MLGSIWTKVHMYINPMTIGYIFLLYFITETPDIIIKISFGYVTDYLTESQILFTQCNKLVSIR